MTKEQKVIRTKVGLLEVAKQLGNVSWACKMLGPGQRAAEHDQQNLGQSGEMIDQRRRGGAIMDGASSSESDLNHKPPASENSPIVHHAIKRLSWSFCLPVGIKHYLWHCTSL